jgi:hypothetical protein
MLGGQALVSEYLAYIQCQLCDLCLSFSPVKWGNNSILKYE